MHMEAATAMLALVGSTVGALLGILALIRRIDGALEGKITHVVDENLESRVMGVLVEAGLTRKGHKGLWANGSTNLPDSIGTIWRAIEANSGQIHDVRNQVESLKE